MRTINACLTGGCVILLGFGIGCHDNNNSRGNFAVANKTYNQVENCSQTPTGTAAFCALAQAQTQLTFTNLGGGQWQAMNVPDSGFLAVGTFSGRTFNYTATNPTGFTETGTITFNSNGNQFSGSSTYTANDNSFTGECNFNGAVSPNVPSNATTTGACP